MLSYWGSVIVEAQTTGFAMEFIGDVNDSVSMLQNAGTNNRGEPDSYMAAGVNVQ